MELVYTLTPSEKSLFYSLGHSDASTICSCWSKNNLLAYTWEKVVHGYIERYLTIVDPNQPWNAQKIPISSSITCLRWNDTGKKLLYATSHGTCAVWCSSMNLTNMWREKPAFSIDLHNEVILAAAWLCGGRNLTFMPDKMVGMRDGDTREKAGKTSHKPCLTQLGGQPMEGYVVVTASGILAVKCLTQIELPVSAKTQLKNVSSNLRIADIAFNTEGNIVIMASDGNIANPVRFWTVQLNYDDDALRLSFEVDVIPSITMECLGDPTTPYTTISHAYFVSSSDHVIICASHSSRSVIEAWLYKDYKIDQSDLHPAFFSLSVMEERIKRWKKVVSSVDFPKILHVSLPHISIPFQSLNVTHEIKLFNVLQICIVLPNNTLKFLHRIKLAEMYSYKISEDVVTNAELIDIGRKRRGREDIASTITHVQFSHMSCALAALDSHCNLIMYKLSPCLQKGAMAPIGHALVQLAGFCISTGHEWWDVLLHVDSTYVNHLCDQLHQEFGSMAKPLQQMFSSRLLALEMSIYQRSSRYAEANDCFLRLMFKTITVVFRSLLRPHQNSSDEQGLAEKLHEVCTSSFETDINKLLQSVDTDLKILQSLQQLIQYVADVTLYLLAIVPNVSQGGTGIPGASLLRNREFLENLRELLVIIQMWKLLKAACAPVFSSLDDKVDPLPLIFKLLTEIVQVVSSGEFQGRFPDVIVESSRKLSNQIVIPSMDIISPVNGVLQRMHSTTSSFRFEVGKRPYNLQLVSKFANMRNLKVDDVAKVDHLRRVYLGTCPTSQRRICSRCGVSSLLNSVPDSAIQFWEQRFAQSCICGGSWHVVGPVTKK